MAFNRPVEPTLHGGRPEASLPLFARLTASVGQGERLQIKAIFDCDN